MHNPKPKGKSTQRLRLPITAFQMRLLVALSEQQTPRTTYQLSKLFKKSFWYTQEACRMLWAKGFLFSINCKWSTVS